MSPPTFRTNNPPVPVDVQLSPIALRRFKINALQADADTSYSPTAYAAGQLVKCRAWDGRNLGTRDYVVALVGLGAVGSEIMAMKPQGGTGRFFNGSHSGRRQQVAWQQISPFQMMPGKVLADWVPGTNTLSVVPCADFGDNTPLAGASPITVYLTWPLTRAAPCCPVRINEIIGFTFIAASATIGSGAPAPVYMIWDTPILPLAANQYEVIYNASAAPGITNLVCGFMQFGARPPSP